MSDQEVVPVPQLFEPGTKVPVPVSFRCQFDTPESDLRRNSIEGLADRWSDGIPVGVD